MIIDRLPNISEQLMFSVKRASEVLNWNQRRIWDQINIHRDAVAQGKCTEPKTCEGECGFGIASLRANHRVFVTNKALEQFVKSLKAKTY
tara:strand:- start:297 stop:566 length:270 start_codon:yes stop_codon:yes gene_type:complete